MSKKLPEKRFLLFLTCVFVLLPLVFFHSTQDPALAPRYFITSVFLSLFFLSFLFNKQDQLRQSQLPLIIVRFFCAQQIWMLITIFWSINPGDAVQEWFRLLSFSLFFVLAFLVLNKRKDGIQLLVRSSFIALLIFTFYGAKQLYPLIMDFFEKGTPIVIDLTICSSLANKNFFAEVLTLMLPFYVFGMRTEKGKWLFLSFAGLLICLFWILLLQTVTTWFAILIGLLVLMIFSRMTKSKDVQTKQKIGSRKVIALSAIGLIVLSSVFVLYSKSKNISYLEKKIEMVKLYWAEPELFNTTSSENNNSIYERILVWKNSFKLIGENPVFGAGLNNWKLLQSKYGVGGTGFLNSGMVHFEHPHNDYLLIWSEQGIPGIIFYLFFFFLVLRQAFYELKVSRDPVRRKLLLFASMAVSSFMVLSFFGYPRSRYYVMLILMIWVALIYISSDETVKHKSERTASNRLFIMLCFLFSGFTIITSWFWLSGEIHLRRAEVYQLRKNYPRMIREVQTAKSWLFPIDGTTTPLVWYEGMANFYSGNIPAARTSFEAAEKVNPYHLRVLNDLATTYEQSGMPDKAIAHYKTGLQITPLFIEGLLNLSAAYFNIHQPDSALEVISRIPEMKLSYRDQKNYSAFLPAILYAVAAKDSIKIEDRLKKQSYFQYIANDTLLIHTFKEQRKKGVEFNGALYHQFLTGNVHQ